MRIAAVTLLAASLAAAPAAPARLSDLAWIGGRWVNEDGGDLSEEVWTDPAGDSMLGMWRLVSGGKVQIFEILTLTEVAEGVTLRLRHFDPRLVGREDKERAVELRLVALEGRSATFEGTEYSGKGRLRLTYRRPDDKSLFVTLEKEGGSEQFRFERWPQP